MIEIKDMVTDDFSKKMPLKYYPRKLSLNFKKDFDTPLRAVTDPEYKKKTEFPNQIKMDDFISIDVQYFSNENLSSFLNKNGAMSKLKDNINNFTKGATDSCLSILSMRPYISQWQTLNERQFSRFIRFLGMAMGEMNTRSMPDIPLNFEYNKAVKQFCEQFKESNPIVWVNLAENDESVFSKKIDVLKKQVKDGILKMIGFYAGAGDTWDKYNVNLDYVYTELSMEEVLLVYEGSWKAFTQTHIGVSKLHYHPFEVFDVVSPYKYPRGGSSKKKTNLEKAKNSPFLDRAEVSLTPFKKIDRSNIDKYIDRKSKESIDEIIEKIDRGRDIENSELKEFVSFANIQQVVAGQEEMDEISKRIKNSETYDYLEEKKSLETAVKNRLSKSHSVNEYFE